MGKLIHTQAKKERALWPAKGGEEKIEHNYWHFVQ